MTVFRGKPTLGLNIAFGKAFFIEYFPVLNQIDWHNDEQINLTKQNILDDLKYKRRPDGGNYTKTGLDM